VRRVRSSKVLVLGNQVGAIEKGFLIYLGIHRDDTHADLLWLIKKILGLRIFEGPDGRMSQSINSSHGVLLISQFTLFGNLRKGCRPSFNHAADPARSKVLYEEALSQIKTEFGGKVASGIFAADMQVHAVDDGPVSIWIDSQNPNY